MTSHISLLIANLFATLSMILAARTADENSIILPRSDTVYTLECESPEFPCEFGSRETGDYLLGTTPILVDPVEGEVLRFAISFDREPTSKITYVKAEHRSENRYGAKVRITVDDRHNRVTTEFTSQKSRSINYVIKYYGK